MTDQKEKMAGCGCVYHAEQGIPCEHDRAIRAKDVGPTPGPWRYEPGTETIRAFPSNYWIASMDSFEGMVNNPANARLIAAAPDLLRAVQDILALHDPKKGLTDYEAFLQTITLCHEALDKVDGK